METQNKGKKILGVIRSVFVSIILIVSVLMMVFTIVSTTVFGKADKNLFGYKFMIVLSDSMSKTHFSAGDVIVVKEVDLKTLKPGDIISFYDLKDKNDGGAVQQQYKNQSFKVVTHMIKEVTTDEKGNIAFRTYGTTKGPEHVDERLATMIIGKYQTHIPKLGYFFQFIKTTPGYIVCILVPFLLLIISQAVNCVRLFRRYRAEQMAGLKEERDRLETEREENRKMMEELMALKAQMASAGGLSAQAQPAPVEPMVDEKTVTADPVVEEPVVEEPVVEEPVVEETVVEEPAAEEPAAEESVVEEPVVEETVVEEPAVEEPVAEEPAVEEPVVEETAAEETAAEEPAVEEPVVEETVAEEPVVEETAAEEAIESAESSEANENE